MSKLSTTQKEQCVIRYRNGESVYALMQEYATSNVSIYRWDRMYDGTAESLEPKSSAPKTRHPKQMPIDEEQRIVEIVTSNPQITDMQLSKLLGTNRSPAVLHRKREKLLGKRTIHYKYDYATLFSEQQVDEINTADLTQGILPNDFYVIEVVSDLFLQVNETHNPASITPYLTVALKFEKQEDAQEFVQTLISDNMRWVPKIRHIVAEQTKR